MTKSFKFLPAILLATLLAACLLAYYSTREAAQPDSGKKTDGSEELLVDTSLLRSAVQLAPLAATPDEQRFAREAWRLADNELDLAFAAALREAGADAEAKLPANSPLRRLSDRIKNLKERVETDKKKAEELGKADSDELDLAQAQLTLDQDELDDAEQDLAREGGDQRAKLQRLLQEHQSSDKIADQTIKFASPGATGTLAEQIREWMSLTKYQSQVRVASAKAAEHAGTLLDQHKALEQQLPSQPGTETSVSRLRQLSSLHKTLAGLDRQAQDAKQLVSVYQGWSALIEKRQRNILHLLLRSFAAIIAILLVTWLLIGLTHRALLHVDRRRAHQVKVIAHITLEVGALLLILLVVLGAPTQLSTMIGLLTAGLAVVMKDFIVSFFGWFTLMGKNGISVGDWVEIEGVSGEVIEIGLLKTVLLELGNWTETGHPTGRRVTFSNSFAMEQHYFNFSTSGQWLWDEIQFTLPSTGDPYQMAAKVREIVEYQTQQDAADAAKDWERVTRQYGAREYYPGPALNLRPRDMGLEVVVRYITRAPQRNVVRAKLFQAIVELLRDPARASV